MRERVVKFRTSVVGGFDRQDVIGYIKSLADERNELRLQLSERRVNEDEAALNSWRESFEKHPQEYENAEDVLRALEAKHEEIGFQIQSLREHLALKRKQLEDNCK